MIWSERQLLNAIEPLGFVFKFDSIDRRYIRRKKAASRSLFALSDSNIGIDG
ncbi:MAG: hypothetical protein K0S04_2362 [Herbinix sp.]|jgi:hypothetical protein|nr:hypothetical protein [Herbinix sp.]